MPDLAFVAMLHLQEHLKVELHCANGVRQLEFLQHARVQDTEDTDGVILAGKVDLDRGGVTGEESLI